MINSQEIIERSIWSAINEVLIDLDMAIDPNKYLPVSPQNKKLADEAISKLKRYIPVFGPGSSQSKGAKASPRIVINARGFIPGAIGLPKILREKKQGLGYTTTEQHFSTLDHMVDVHLVANNQEDIRLLTDVMFWALPQMGYIKPYLSDSLLDSGNIFIQLANFFDNPNTEAGLLEKVYQFNLTDCLVYEKLAKTTIDGEEVVDILPFITDVSLALDQLGYTVDDLVHTPDTLYYLANDQHIKNHTKLSNSKPYLLNNTLIKNNSNFSNHTTR